ncbi:MAG: DUF2298 domain-containing protein [Candidatus Levyibacteriota bacterium]
MSVSDFLIILQWWAWILLVGSLLLPFTTKLFSSFFDKGYIFSKIIGIALLSYLVFVLGATHIAPFHREVIFGLLALFTTFHIAFLLKRKSLEIHTNWKLFIVEELLFFLSLVFWSFVRQHQPDIHGLEKFMDFGFINSILRTDYFPPKDMWYSPYPINYYYFGHIATAVLTKLSDIPSFYTFNLMVATIFAFCVTCGFSLGGNFLALSGFLQKKGKSFFLPFVIVGIISAYMLSLGGNFHTLYTFFKPYQNENPVPFWQLVFSPNTFPNSYWYPNATRFIYHTIHEFPSYSFVVSDLHGHVLDIPFVLLTIALLFSFMIKQSAFIHIQDLVFLSFFIAVMYMTNAWDGLIYLLLTFLVLLAKALLFSKRKFLIDKIINLANFASSLLVIGGFFLFSLPFSMNFKPSALVGGIGINCPPKFLVILGKVGPILGEAEHCQHSPLYQLFILYGFFYFWVAAFLIFLFKYRKKQKITTVDAFILLLIILSTFLIVAPEFVYLKDIYATYFRANTMFKLVYQAFMMLSLASVYITIRILSFFFSQKLTKTVLGKLIILLGVGSFFYMLVFIYPYFAVASYYDNLSTNHGLNGTNYLQTLYPTDAQAITWINDHIKGQPIILEAQGDSYTDYARISANTGLPTVIGWPVHEWLWRGSWDVPSPRIADVEKLYDTSDIKEAKQLIKKYGVSFVYVGDLEWKKYPKLSEEKFTKLGNVVYRNSGTTIYQIIPSRL